MSRFFGPALACASGHSRNVSPRSVLRTRSDFSCRHRLIYQLRETARYRRFATGLLIEPRSDRDLCRGRPRAAGLYRDISFIGLFGSEPTAKATFAGRNQTQPSSFRRLAPKRMTGNSTGIPAIHLRSIPDSTSKGKIMFRRLFIVLATLAVFTIGASASDCCQKSEDCCQPQQACCISGADCCDTKADCCETKEACCDTQEAQATKTLAANDCCDAQAECCEMKEACCDTQEAQATTTLAADDCCDAQAECCETGADCCSTT